MLIRSKGPRHWISNCGCTICRSRFTSSQKSFGKPGTRLESPQRKQQSKDSIHDKVKEFQFESGHIDKKFLFHLVLSRVRQELHWWTYHFFLVKARVHFLMSDISGSLTTLNQGAALADQRGDSDLKVLHTLFFCRCFTKDNDRHCGFKPAEKIKRLTELAFLNSR